jgi:hypothetical protein
MASGFEPVLVVEQRLDPAAHAIGNGDRNGRLHARAAGERTLPPLPAALIERRNDRPQPAGEEFGDRLQPQHQAGIDDILAGGAEMDVLRRLFADRKAQLPDEFGHRDAVDRRGATQGCNIRGKAPAGLRYAIGGRMRNDAMLRFGARERCLE